MFYNSSLLIKEKISQKKTSVKPLVKSFIHSENIPNATYDVPHMDEVKSKTVKIPIVYHGTLKDLINDSSDCEFCIDIANGKPVTLKRVEVTRLSNTSPITFKILAVGTGAEFYNIQKLYDYSKNESGSSNVSNCFTHVPSRGSDYQNINNPVLFSAYTPDIRKKVEEFDIIKNVKSEVSNYITKHDNLSNTLDKYKRPIRGIPRTPDSYVDKIIQYGNELNTKEVIMKHPKYITENGETVFNMSTKLDNRFFNFVNMTYAKDKLLLSKNWSTESKKEHESLPYKTFEKAIELSDKIKKAIGIVKQLKLNFVPVMKDGINRNTFVSGRNERKPEYHSICLDLLVTYIE